MKKIGLDTVGGRIRRVRQDAKQPMHTFADELGITANYVGLLERGERNPSTELLLKISTVMDVPFDWLAHGDKSQPQENRPWEDTSNALSDPAPTVNPQLYLSIAMVMAPAITKDMLAPLLTAPAKTIDDILTGKTVEYDPEWRTGYTVLAKNLNLPALRRDLQTLDAFLAWEETAKETAKRNSALLRVLQNYAAKALKAVEVYRINDKPPNAVPPNIPYTDIILTGKAGEYTINWYFKYLPEEDPEDFSAEETFHYAEALADWYNCPVFIVLTSEYEYNRMEHYYNTLEVERGALAIRGISRGLSEGIATLFLNIKTEEIWELNLSEDDDPNS